MKLVVSIESDDADDLEGDTRCCVDDCVLEERIKLGGGRVRFKF